MTDPDHPAIPDPADRLRAFCDGELPADEAARVETEIGADAQLARRVRFERDLRSKVGDVLGSVKAPVDLEARVRAALRAAEPAPPARTAWWVGPKKANFLAVAASLALVAGAVLFGIFGRPIDSIRGAGVQPASEVARQMSADHFEVASKGLWKSPRWTDGGLASREIALTLGGEVPPLPLEELGYDFAGVDITATAGGHDAFHIMYKGRGPDEDGCPHGVLSLYAMSAEHVESDQRLAWIWKVAAQAPDCKHRVLQTIDGGIVYFLVSCDESVLTRAADAISRSGRSD